MKFKHKRKHFTIKSEAFCKRSNETFKPPLTYGCNIDPVYPLLHTAYSQISLFQCLLLLLEPLAAPLFRELELFTISEVDKQVLEPLTCWCLGSSQAVSGNNVINSCASLVTIGPVYLSNY